MELVYCSHFSPCEFVRCSILYVFRYAWAVVNVFLFFFNCVYYRVVWDEDKLNVICDDVVIVLHCGLWSGLKCEYEADWLPRSKSRGRGSVHINFPCPLDDFKMAAGIPLGKFASMCLKVEWNAAAVFMNESMNHLFS